MIFTNSEQNIKIDLIDPFLCKLYALEEGTNQLLKFDRMLTFYSRGESLDGGEPVKFEHTLCQSDKCVSVKGDVFGAVSALCELGWITEILRDDIIQQAMIMMTLKVKDRISPIRQDAFVEKINTTLASVKQDPYTPSMFASKQ